mgnify:CR=1 FL=1|jgi:hypothetical protein
MRTFLLLLFGAISAAAIPSERDALASAKRDALGVYTAAQRTQDKAKFLEAIGRLQAVGGLVISANNAALGAIKPGYPNDIKSLQARQTWDKKMGDIRRTLSGSNREIAAFAAPAEMTPEGIRAVDTLVRTIDKAIETHHAACLNIR